MAAVQRGPDGKIFMVGDWVPYAGGANTRSPMYNAPNFDSYGRGDGPTSVCFPPGTNCTNCDGTDPNIPVDNGARWYFGPAYHNPRTIDDIESFVGNPCNEVDEIDAGFFFAAPAPAAFFAIHFIIEEHLSFDPVTGLCTDPATMTSACNGNGVILDFGVLAPSTGGYYAYCASGLIAAGIGMLMPADASGSHEIRYAIAYDPGTGTITPHPGPLQPMLWGTGEDNNQPWRPGTQNEDSYDDDAPADDVYTNPAECYSYAAGICPDPLGKMVAFLSPYCPADYNRDGFVDGIDADQFNNDFESTDPAAQSRADFNDDCFVDGIDADMFNNEFESPCP
jgi:hypothetical protein